MRFSLKLSHQFKTAIAVIIVCQQAAPMWANPGTQLPFDQYRAGSETTSTEYVINGGFEQVGSDGVPVGWTLEGGSLQTTTPFLPPDPSSTVGSFAVQGAVAPNDSFHRYSQAFSFPFGEQFVLSAYLWNRGVPQGEPSLNRSAVELDPTASQDPRSIWLDDVPESRPDTGYFVYRTFVSQGADSVKATIYSDLSGPPLIGQLDNIAITPITEFRPPATIPEPGTALSAALMVYPVSGRRPRRRMVSR